MKKIYSNCAAFNSNRFLSKETKTVTKVDPKTGKTITVEVPVEDKETAKVENPAIKDSLGVYHATFKLEKGKTYPLQHLPKRCANAF